MKQQMIILMFLLCAATSLFATIETSAINSLNRLENITPRWTAKDDALVKDRLQMMISPVELKFDAHAKEYVQAYTTYGYKGTEKMLGSSALYFPIFEEYLRKYNLPQQLKYLPMIESKLNPHAASGAGAVGSLLPNSSGAGATPAVLEPPQPFKKQIFKSVYCDEK